MKVLVDTAKMDEIKRLYDKYPIDGVTSNPTILKMAGKPPMEVLKEIAAFLPEGQELHAQVVSLKAEDILKEAIYMRKELGEKVVVKIPVTDEGMKAIPMVVAEGITVTATAIYSAMQAFMAAKAGASYVAPYINRLDNMGAEGIEIAKEIHDMLILHGLDCVVVGASFKNSSQIMNLCRYGVPAITAAADVLENLIAHPATTKAVADFTADFETLTQSGKTMLDF